MNRTEVSQFWLCIPAGIGFYLTLAIVTVLRNPRNRLAFFGSVSLVFFALLGYSNSFRNFPGWLAICFGTISLLAALTTLFVLVLRGWQAVHKS
jgi:hypothetical protein